MIPWPVIPSPWLLIGFGLVLVVSNAVSFVKGGEARENEMLAAAFKVADQVVRRANVYRREDIQRARLAAEREGRARLAARQLQHDFELEAARGQLLTQPRNPAQDGTTPPPGPVGPVQLSDAAVGLFNGAIDAYNAAAQPASSSGDPVPPDAAPGPRDAGRSDRVAHAAGQPLRLSGSLRQDAPGGRRVAAAAD